MSLATYIAYHRALEGRGLTPCHAVCFNVGMATTDTAAIELLLDRIADTWGGKDCPRGFGPNGAYRFLGDEGVSRYEVYLPRKQARMFEDSGRPIPGVRVPAGKVIVRCLDDAPDCFWHVNLDGSYSTYSRPDGQIDLTPVVGDLLEGEPSEEDRDDDYYDD